ncbi:MAG: hypothetical protein WAL42_10080, partial [Nitrososphaeraceae archaeon]
LTEWVLSGFKYFANYLGDPMFKRIPDCAIIYNWDVSNTYKHRPYANQSINIITVFITGESEY